MPSIDDQVVDVARAYEILGVPPTASAPVIKQAYRKLTKRWHPDLYRPGTQEHAEATQMMKLLNHAYAVVSGAPLRYQREEYQSHRNVSRPAQSGPLASDHSMQNFARTNARWEYWIRFVFGTIGGLVLSLEVFVQFYRRQPSLPIVGAVMLVCGFLAARFGDDFWLNFFGRRWRW